MKKISLVFFILCVFASGTILFIKHRQVATGNARPFKGLRIDGMEITEGKGDIVSLRREGAHWYTGPWPVDTDAVNSAVEALRKVELYHMVSVRREEYADYAVNRSEGLVLKLLCAGQKQVKIFVGRQSAEATKGFLRIEGDPAVYLVNAVQKALFPAENLYWRSRDIIREERESLRSIEIESNDRKYIVFKGTSAWSATADAVCDLKAIGFVEGVKIQPDTGNGSVVRIGLALAGGSSSYIVFNRKGRFYARPDGADIIYEISAAQARDIIGMPGEDSGPRRYLR